MCELQKGSNCSTLRPQRDSVPFRFPERIVLFLSEERDQPMGKYGLHREHLTTSLYENTGKLQSNTPLFTELPEQHKGIFPLWVLISIPPHTHIFKDKDLLHHDEVLPERIQLKVNLKCSENTKYFSFSDWDLRVLGLRNLFELITRCF